VRFTAGDRVLVRGSRWVVEEATAFGDSTLLELSPIDPAGAEQPCRLLVPFDRPVVCDHSPTIRAVTPRRWGHHLQAVLSKGRAHGQLRAAPRAAIAILPFQLEPALALIRGHASRVLLADEVGLGKTIQAGLMLAELQQRGWCDRALIITPSGLRQQWADELERRFHIRATIVDATTLSMLAASLPSEVNPWACEPVAITSIDFVKQPEVLQTVIDSVWDLVIVDEAHQASAASLRHDAIQRIASRARHVVLATATPHTGDEHAYEELCALGRFDEPDRILLFRRTRGQVGLSRTRRVHLLPVRLTAHEAEMHRLLDEYVAQLWRIARDAGKHDVRLVAMVLAKRAFSSAHSLLRSLERRVAGLSGDSTSADQRLLPFEIDIDNDSSDEEVMPAMPAFERVEDERDALHALIAAASRARTNERKMDALHRIFRRVPESIIVFTEYRDTLDAIAAVAGGLRTFALLHGGLSPGERRDSVAAFTRGDADLLIATDAGSEGLNLQSHCRVVINLELPWNPIRLEQRIGRVDRIGQARTVHAINLFGRGTAEGDVLARLQQRIDRIRMSEIELAACVIDRREPPPLPAAPTTHTATLDLRVQALDEAHRISGARQAPPQRDLFAEGIVPVTLPRPRRNRLHRNSSLCAIAFMRVRLVTRAGRLIEDTLVPLAVPIAWHACARRREVRARTEAFLRAFHGDLVSTALEYARRRENVIAEESADWVVRAIARERHIGRGAAAGIAPFVQAGLFDSRALKQQVESRRRVYRIGSETKTHASLLEAESRVCVPQDPELALLLITRLRIPPSAGTCIA
jgi:superfamily II DNA or RNA helicase